MGLSPPSNDKQPVSYAVHSRHHANLRLLVATSAFRSPLNSQLRKAARRHDSSRRWSVWYGFTCVAL